MDDERVVFKVTEETFLEDFDGSTRLVALNVRLLGVSDRVLGVPLREVDENECAAGQHMLGFEFHAEGRGSANDVALGRQDVLRHAATGGLDAQVLGVGFHLID